MRSTTPACASRRRRSIGCPVRYEQPPRARFRRPNRGYWCRRAPRVRPARQHVGCSTAIAGFGDAGTRGDRDAAGHGGGDRDPVVAQSVEPGILVLSLDGQHGRERHQGDDHGPGHDPNREPTVEAAPRAADIARVVGCTGLGHSASIARRSVQPAPTITGEPQLRPSEGADHVGSIDTRGRSDQQREQPPCR